MTSIEQLLQDNRLWRGKDCYDREHCFGQKSENDPENNRKKSISTGISALDRQLHWKGWPLHCSSELLCENWGVGELSLLVPALKQISKQRGKIAWINPPYIPYPPALAAMGINPEQCLVLHSKSKEQWWAAEQTLSSSAFAVVLSWFSQQTNSITPYRRLQAAAEKGQCLHFHFRPGTVRMHASPAKLRLYLQIKNSRLDIEILKQPGGWGGQQLTISKTDSLIFKQQSPELWPVYHDNRRRTAVENTNGIKNRYSSNHLIPRHNRSTTTQLPISSLGDVPFAGLLPGSALSIKSKLIEPPQLTLPPTKVTGTE